MRASYHIASPPISVCGGGAAIAVVELAGDVGAVLDSLGVAPIALGCTGLREAPGIDTMVIARIAESHAIMFPHAGPAVLKKLAAALQAAGAAPRMPTMAREAWPEAAD